MRKIIFFGPIDNLPEVILDERTPRETQMKTGGSIENGFQKIQFPNS